MNRNNPIRMQSFQHLSGILCLLAFQTTGCNGKPNAPVSPVQVQNTSVSTSLAPNQDELLNFSITLSTGNFTVIGATLPILNPSNPSAQYGSLSLQPILCANHATCPYGNSVQVGVSLDLSEIAQTQGLPPLLPNGSPLPVGGLQNSTVVTLPIGNTGGDIYFAFGKGVAMFGAAVPFAQMNVVGQTIPGANLFVPITITTPKGPFTLLPGIFTGSAPNTTGIGFFADLSPLAPQSALLASLTGASIGRDESQDGQKVVQPSQLVFKTITPSKSKRDRLYEELLKWNEKGGDLILE